MKNFYSRISLLLVLMAMSTAVNANHSTHYSKATATAVPSAAGKVYVGAGSGVKGSSSSATQNCNGDSGKDTHTYCFTAETTNSAGYTWDGWYDKESGGTKKSSGTNLSYNENVSASSTKQNSPTTITRYARWTAKQFTVTFNLNDDAVSAGSVDPASKTVTYASAYGDLPTPTRRWYSFDGWFTEAASGSQVTANTSVTATSNHEIFAHWTLAPENQTLSWGSTMQFNMAKENMQPISVSSTSGLTAFTYSSDNESVIVIDGEYMKAIAPGTANITVTQPGNDYFNEATLTEVFSVWSKETPMLTENGFSEGENNLKVDDVVSLSLTNVSDGLNGDFTVTASTDNVMGITREGNVLTFTALHEGSTTITVAQAENEDIFAASKTYTFHVTRYEPVFTLSATNLVLDETATLTLENVDGASISFSPEGIVSYNGATGVISTVQAGTTTLTVSQAQTNRIAAKVATYNITVSKKTPTLTVKMNNVAQTSLSIAQGGTATVGFETNSDAAVGVTTVSGGQYAYYKDGKLYASTEYGKTATFRATLPETDTYYGKTVDFSLTITQNNIHVPITMSSSLWNNSSCKTKTEGTTSWDNSNGITLGDINGGGFNKDDKYVILHFEGIPDKLTFDIAIPSSVGAGIGSLMGGVTNVEWYVKESATSTMPSQAIWTSTYDGTSASSQTVQLDPKTRYVLLCYSGNFGAYFKNVKISELKYVQTPEPASVDFGSAIISSGEVTKTVNVNWCNIAPLTVTSTNDRFTVTPASFGTYESYSSQELTVSFTHTDEIGTQEGNIILSNGNSTYTKTIPVKAITTKRPQEIVWNQELVNTGFAMNVDEFYPDATVNPVATTVNGGRITFESDNSDVVEIVEDTIIYAKSAGTANVTAHQAGDAQYQEVEDTKEFTVTMLQKQTIAWDQNLLTLLTTSAPVELTATATSGGEITYVSANENVVKVEGNVLTVVNEGETTVTATQAGGIINDQEWLGISQSHTVIVRNPASQCNERALFVGSITLSSSKLSEECELEGTPTSLTFSALHGTKSNGAWMQKPTYAALMVDQYAKIDGVWKWYNIYNQVVGTDATASGTIALDETATKLRFRTTESETTHTISNISVPRKKYMRADATSFDVEVESNAIWEQAITVTHSNIDIMTISTKQNLFTLSSTTLGDGCGDYGDDQFVVSYAPQQKYVEYKDTIVITDGKAEPSTITIPVRLYSKGLNQSISGFDLPLTAKTTDEIAVSATASSELEVSYESSDDQIAYVENGRLVILKDGTVTITAKQEGNEKYDAATPVAKTVVISKVATSITTAPTAATITYGQPLSESALADGEASVAGMFAWETPDEVPAAGTPSYNVVFVPTQSNIYATSTTLVSVRVEKATPTIITYPTAGDITIAQALSNSELTGGEASVAGTFQWKNPAESRLPFGDYERTVVFIPNDENNYNRVEITVGFSVLNVLAKINEMPTAVVDNPVYGMTLADVLLSGGSTNVTGTFQWVDESIVLLAGTHDYAVVFVPEDQELYSNVNVTISLTVAKATPAINELPVAAELTYGQTLANATLTGGEGSVPGSFAWADATIVPAAGTTAYAVVFAPTDQNNYNNVNDEVSVTVARATPDITTLPDALEITYGQTLANSTLSNGEASVAGTFAWTDNTIVPAAGASEQEVTFTPTDVANYTTVTFMVWVSVGQTASSVTTAPTASNLVYGQTLSQSTLTGGEGSVPGSFAWEDESITPAAGTRAYTVIFTPTSDNYTTATVEVNVTTEKASTEVITAPVAASIAYGQTLADATLFDGVASVAGTFAWADATIAPSVGAQSYEVIFTPTDTANYNTTTVNVEVATAKATTTITTLPVASAITYGQTLADAALTGGEGSVPGTIAWEDETIAPSAGTRDYKVLFTPTDVANYAGAEAMVSVTTEKATTSIETAPLASGITYGQTLAEAELNGGVASQAGTFGWEDEMIVPAAGTRDYIVVFTPVDADNYEGFTLAVSVATAKANPVVSVWPTANSISIGQALSEASLLGGLADVDGKFAWEDSTETFDIIGPYMRNVVFTPVDKDNYNSLTAEVKVEVGRAKPAITAWPVAVDLTYGQALAESMLSNGEAAVDGTFAWKDGEQVLDAGSHECIVVFTPDDLDNYASVNGQVTVNVAQVTTTVNEAPVAAELTYGQTLANATLTGGEGSVPGSFAWADATIVPAAGEGAYDVIFTPTDATNFATATIQVSVAVAQATAIVETAPMAAGITYGQTLADATLSNGVANVAGTFGWETPDEIPVVGTRTYNVIFTPTDDTNYLTAMVEVSVTVAKAVPTITMLPTAASISYGKPLSESELTNGVAKVGDVEVPGTFAWVDGDQWLMMGTSQEAIVFIPADENNYDRVSGQVSVTITKGQVEVTVAPEVSEIELGQTLADAYIWGGETNVLGWFEWEDPSFKPNGGWQSCAAVFYPEDDDFDVLHLNLMVHVKQLATTIIEWPTASAITCGEKLEASLLDGGEATVDGHFEWKEPELIPEEGTAEYVVVFIPDNTNYESIEGKIYVTVNAAAITTGVDETEEATEKVQKVLRGNHVYILRGGRTYTITGRLVE